MKQSALLSHLTTNTVKLQIFQFVPEQMTRYMVRNKFEHILERTDKLKPIRLHDFRHSHVALLIENEEEPYPIKERVRHASIRTTYDIYGHLYPSKQQGIADKLDSLI